MLLVLTTDLYCYHEKPKLHISQTFAWVDMGVYYDLYAIIVNLIKKTAAGLAQTGNKVSMYKIHIGSRRFIGGLFESNDERNQCRHKFDW